MNSLLLNREFQMPADGMYHVVPLGEFPHPSGVVQVIDGMGVAAMLQDFRNRSASPNYPGLLVDFDHFSSDSDHASEAAGWITELENRTDSGLWAKIRWSDTGEAAVNGGRYRMVSPVFSAAEVDKLQNRRLRVKRLVSVALTNDPNLRGMVPLSNRAEPDGSADTQHKQKGSMKAIATKLGLSAEASEDAILAEVVKLQNRASTAEAAVAPLQSENEQLKTDNKALLEAQVDADLATYANRFKPEAREKWKTALLANRASALELLQSMPEQQVAAAANIVNMPNRANAKVPGQGASAKPTTFPELVQKHLAAGKSKGSAIDAAILENRQAYSDWRETSDGTLSL